MISTLSEAHLYYKTEKTCTRSNCCDKKRQNTSKTSRIFISNKCPIEPSTDNMHKHLHGKEREREKNQLLTAV